MTLSPGTRLGPYEIVSPLGAGGMGEVWKARDTRLNRTVAIKTSREQFSERFEREALAVAALNHPNICHLYDVGPNYLVMEFVEGDSPAGPLPEPEVIRIAEQIAAALEAAHEKGIVHRDLKPPNIKITPDGTVKVLDFGLAKMGETAEITSDSPTILSAGGMILGTAAYMAPEQARGKAVDKRADIWAFGVVLYELLTGDQLHKGETVSDTLAAVLREDPDFGKVPARFRPLLQRCLEKDPRKRLRDIGDAMLLIAPEKPAVPGAPAARVTSRLPWALAAGFALAAVAIGVVHFREKPPAPPPVSRYLIRLPEGVRFTASSSVVLSPDGLHAAFSAINTKGPSQAGNPTVWVQDLDASEARELPAAYTGPTPPPFFWSYDSKYVVYSENSPKLKKVDIATGTTIDICDKPGPPIGGSWNRDGVIIFGSTSTGLWKVPASGGTPAPLTKLDAARGEQEHESPHFLPDGRHFLYLRVSRVKREESGIYEGSLDDPPEKQSLKRILATQLGVEYVPGPDGGPGQMLFLRGQTLMGQTFDPARLELKGDPVALAEGVGAVYQTPYFTSAPAVVLYRTTTSTRELQLTWIDAAGKELGKIGEPGMIANVRLSPDGSRLAYLLSTASLSDEDVWILDLKRDTSTRLTFGPHINQWPIWSPDGNEVVFCSNRNGVFELYRKAVNGAREEQLLLHSDLNLRPDSWSPDGRFLLYSTSKNITFNGEDLWVLPMTGADRTPFPFQQSRFDETDARISPDGRWVAYASDESGRDEVYVREFHPSPEAVGTGGKWQVSKAGGSWPIWRSDGKELMYIDLGHIVRSVNVKAGAVFESDTPKVLYAMPPGSNVMWTLDLQRFILPVPVETKTVQGFNVLLNWTSLLKKH